MSSEVAVERLEVVYDATTVIPPLDLHIRRGEFVSLLGPSGCGKTTLLRTIAGFVSAHAGRVLIDDREVTRVDAQHRGIGFVFQSYALFPQLSVRGNVAFGLRVQRVGRRETERRVNEALELAGLGDVADRHPPQLSGGQQQRVAIARVLVTEPGVLLMDEPLANLDVELRVAMREELRRLHRESGVTTLYVTHDQEEALALSDRVAVMAKGALLQVGSPADVYLRPETAFVAAFIGRTNLLTTEAAKLFGLVPPRAGSTLGVRPESVTIGDRGLDHRAHALVSSVEYLGPTSRYRLQVGNQQITAVEAGVPRARVGETVVCGLRSADLIRVATA